MLIFSLNSAGRLACKIALIMVNYPFEAPWQEVVAFLFMILFSLTELTFTLSERTFSSIKRLFYPSFIVIVCQREIQTTGEHVFFLGHLADGRPGFC